MVSHSDAVEPGKSADACNEKSPKREKAGCASTPIVNAAVPEGCETNRSARASASRISQDAVSGSSQTSATIAPFRQNQVSTATRRDPSRGHQQRLLFRLNLTS